VRLLRRRWFQILVSGLILLFLVERTLVATSNPNYVPSVILLGAFLVPITFATYLYERLPGWEVPLPALASCFLLPVGRGSRDGRRGYARVRCSQSSWLPP
jgi:protease PrsW